MRKIIVLAIIAMLSGAICNSQAINITGSGNVIKETRNLDAFTAITDNGIFNVVVKQGDNHTAIIETDDNVIQYVETVVEKGRLIIRVKKDVQIKRVSKANIFVTVKNLTDVKTNGTGSMSVSDIKDLRDFNFEANGTGNADLNFTCKKLTIKNSGTGSLSFDGACTNLALNNSSTGDVKVKGISAQNLSVNNNGTGRVHLAGKAAIFDLRNSGTGNVDALDMIADNIDLFNNGTGNVAVYAEKELSIISFGTGDVKYKGNAVVKKMTNKGVGSVHKI